MNTKVSISGSRVAIWVAAAAAVNFALFFIGQSLGATYAVNSPAPVDAFLTGVATVMPLAIGVVVILLVGKKSLKVRNILLWAGFVVALISAPNGWVMSQDAATGLTLGAMHLVAAFAWLLAVKPRKAA